MAQVHKTTKLGFTLVELLVVILVIGMIVGLLMPAISAVRNSAHRTLCASNLRQIGLAMNVYLDVQGNRGHYPYAAMLPSVTPELPSLVELLGPHLEDNKAVFHCPGDSEYYFNEGLSYEYPSFRFEGKTRQQALVIPFGKTKKKSSAEIWLLYDYDNFHGVKGQDGARNVLYIDGHVDAL